MDLMARIQAQNDEIDQQPHACDNSRAVVRTQQAMIAHAGTHLNQQLQQAHITEEALRAQERELDMQLQFERTRAGAMPPPPRQGPPTKLTHPHNKENHAARGSIPLIPDARGAPPPSTAAKSVANSVAPSERRRRPVHFSHLMMKEGGTSQMDEFMNPTLADGNIREQMRRAGVEPKNHQREARERLNEIAAQKRAESEGAAARDDERKRREQSLRDKSRAKHQQAQAVGPSAYPEPPAQRGASAGRRASKNAADEPTRHHAPGAMPDYLRKRKEQWEAEAAAEAARAAAAAECPPGLRLVGAEEKERILMTLAEEKAKSAHELQSLPFVVKTRATQLRKDQLEERLTQIESATAEYMKEKVFVPA